MHRFQNHPREGSKMPAKARLTPPGRLDGRTGGARKLCNGILARCNASKNGGQLA
jgi:hypothetical protein